MTALAAPTDARPPGWLVAQIAAAKVFDEAQLRPYLAEFLAAAGRSGDSADLAGFLVQAGILTEFQAEKLLFGEASKLVLGPYLLTAPVGSGSLGTVYQAVGKQDRKRYAVKVLPLRSLWNVHQAKRQVQALAALPPHPAIVPLVDVDTAGGSHYLVWPFAEGASVADRVAAAGRLPTGDAVPILTAVADALAVCHANGIVHGMIKPSNLIVGPDGQVRVLDVGMGAILADNLADDESMLDTISTANSAANMVDCAAPESLADPTVRTPAADTYSFGCVLYQMVTGRFPFPDGNFIERVIAHQSLTPTPPRSVHPGVPEWLDQLAAELLSKAPTSRPPMTEVLDRLRKGSGGRTPAPVKPAVKPVEAVPFETRKPVPVEAVDRKAVHELSLSAPETRLSRPDVDTIAETPPATPARKLPPVAAPPASAPRRPRPADAHIAAAVAGLPAPVPAAPGPPVLTDNTPPPAGTPAGPGRRSVLRRLIDRLAFWKPPADNVQVSVFGPPAVAPGDNLRVQVFAHSPEAMAGVRTLARAFHGDAELLGTGFMDQDVPRGATIGLHLSAVHAGVSRSLVLFTWFGQPTPRAFEVHVPWESPPGPAAAQLSAGINGVLAGTVKFELIIRPRRG